MDLLYHVYCIVAFPIWIAAISLPNSTSETNPNAVKRNITDNKVTDDINASVVLNTGNDSTESNLFPNLESSTIPRTTNYIDERDKTSLDKDLLTKRFITESSIHRHKNVSFHSSESMETSTNPMSSTQNLEITSHQLETTVHNMADRDMQPNNIYNISSISADTNMTKNNSKIDTTTIFIQNKSTENNVTSQETETTEIQTVAMTKELSTSHSSTATASTQYDMIKHTTEFAQNVPIAYHKKHKKAMHHLNLVPIEDGPFGSLIWKDKKYLISVLVPIGIGIIGAGCIIGMAYVVRFCQKTEQQVQRLRQALVEPKEERNDQIVLLVNSSDDDF